ncbi:PRC-barrel domain containing protein [Rhodobacterales bacterium HKCCE4037]|nr:PRC-barrel domain containing protein [Rhodobacterales bacterium HKCCE4037]
MLRKTLLTASALALSTGIALADAHTSETGMNSGRVNAGNLENLIRSSNLIGGTVYTMTGEGAMGETDWIETDTYDAVGDSWETIGTVEDVVLSRDGQLTGLVVEDAGFLGFGDDSVLIEMSSLRMIDDGSDDFAWVTNITEEQFENMEEVEENWY